jgi:hypothetical protein
VTGPWWAAFGPAETKVTCDGHQHLIRWADGRLTAASHPDAEGELVMGALGGDTPRCVQIVQAWGAHADDLDVLAIGPRTAADQVTAIMPGDEISPLQGMSAFRFFSRSGGSPPWPTNLRPDLFGSAMTARRRRTAAWGRAVPAPSRMPGSRPMIPASRSVAYTSHVRLVSSHRGQGLGHRLGQSLGRNPAAERAENRVNELRMLFALGPEFQWRLSGAVAAAWAAGRSGPDLAAARPALTAALAGRLAPAALAWLGTDPGRVEVTLHDGSGWGQLAATDGQPSEPGQPSPAGLAAALTPDWLARVWAPGLALVAGRLVVAVPQAQWPRARVLALAAPGAEPTEMDVRWEQGQWRPAPAGQQEPDD